MIDRWADIKQASIYHAIRQLEKEGAIQIVRHERDGRLPTKTIYAITEPGHRLFDTLQEEAFLGLYPRYYGFKIALKFNARRSSAEIRDVATRAIALIDAQLAAMDAYLDRLDQASIQRQYDAFFIDHDRQLLLAEKAWIAEAALRADAVRTVVGVST
ncbi:MAG: PadR family transcriptional regulator [Chloroflexales bacterium]|nr:PadR family transcriptional regulator [Chloroflexales bacterium]